MPPTAARVRSFYRARAAYPFGERRRDDGARITRDDRLGGRADLLWLRCSSAATGTTSMSGRASAAIRHRARGRPCGTADRHGPESSSPGAPSFEAWRPRHRPGPAVRRRAPCWRAAPPRSGASSPPRARRRPRSHAARTRRPLPSREQAPGSRKRDARLGRSPVDRGRADHALAFRRSRASVVTPRGCLGVLARRCRARLLRFSGEFWRPCAPGLACQQSRFWCGSRGHGTEGQRFESSRAR